MHLYIPWKLRSSSRASMNAKSSMHIICRGENHFHPEYRSASINSETRASWHGTRIVLRQTWPEAVAIFDWIISLHHQCHGDWNRLSQELGVAESEMTAFLDYVAGFLSNVGNYYASHSHEARAGDWQRGRAQGIKCSYPTSQRRHWANFVVILSLTMSKLRSRQFRCIL